MSGIGRNVFDSSAPAHSFRTDCPPSRHGQRAGPATREQRGPPQYAGLSDDRSVPVGREPWERCARHGARGGLRDPGNVGLRFQEEWSEMGMSDPGLKCDQSIFLGDPGDRDYRWFVDGGERVK
jgi:hypothetical protein